MGRGVATFRKRDLKIAMQVAGDRIVKVTKDGSIVLIPAKPGESDGDGTAIETPEDLRKLI